MVLFLGILGLAPVLILYRNVILHPWICSAFGPWISMKQKNLNRILLTRSPQNVITTSFPQPLRMRWLRPPTLLPTAEIHHSSCCYMTVLPNLLSTFWWLREWTKPRLKSWPRRDTTNKQATPLCKHLGSLGHIELTIHFDFYELSASDMRLILMHNSLTRPSFSAE